jgi:hypothetical protein
MNVFDEGVLTTVNFYFRDIFHIFYTTQLTNWFPFRLQMYLPIGTAVSAPVTDYLCLSDASD